MIEEKCGDVLRATAEAERRAYENTIEELHQKLLVEVKARVEAEEALARARTTLRAHDAAKTEAERTASLLTANLVYFQRARQELDDGLTSTPSLPLCVPQDRKSTRLNSSH